jgi:hypothetical protein
MEVLGTLTRAAKLLCGAFCIRRSAGSTKVAKLVEDDHEMEELVSQLHAALGHKSESCNASASGTRFAASDGGGLGVKLRKEQQLRRQQQRLKGRGGLDAKERWMSRRIAGAEGRAGCDT